MDIIEEGLKSWKDEIDQKIEMAYQTMVTSHFRDTEYEAELTALRQERDELYEKLNNLEGSIGTLQENNECLAADNDELRERVFELERAVYVGRLLVASVDTNDAGETVVSDRLFRDFEDTISEIVLSTDTKGGEG